MMMYETLEEFVDEIRRQISVRNDNRYHFDFDVRTPAGIRQKKNLIRWQSVLVSQGKLRGNSFVSGMEGIVIGNL